MFYKRSPWIPLVAILATLTTASVAFANEDGDGGLQEFVDSLKFQDGTIELGSELARVDLPDSMAYLNPADTDRVLQAWGNPPNPDTMGMIVPKGEDLFADSGWVVIVTYSDEGHIDDDDAASIDYDELLEGMQASVAEANPARVKEGYAAVELLGWAEPPSYAAESHKLYWAKSLQFGESPEATLNYNIRVLGREGVLELNAVTGISSLASVKTSMNSLMAHVDFHEGSRYSDYKPGIDKTAGYGIAALVAGKAAAKVGFFKGILVALLAAKKLVVVAVIAMGAFIKKIFFGGEREAF